MGQPRPKRQAYQEFQVLEGKSFRKSLYPKCYENNLNFIGMARTLGLKFKPHASFNKVDIEEQQALVQSICEAILVTSESQPRWRGIYRPGSLYGAKPSPDPNLVTLR